MWNGLKGLDLVLCGAKRRIRPLQHRPKLMCHYSGKPEDVLRITRNDLSSDALTLRLKDLVRIRDQVHGFNVMMNMPEKGKVTAVRFRLRTLLNFIFCILCLF